MFARVSSRRLEKERKAEYEAEQTEQAILAIRKGIDQPGFLVKHIDENIGSGVFTSRSFEHGQFLIEYRGDLLTAQQGVEREAQYLETNSGCFIYFFRFKGKRYSVDATNYVESIGRMINDAAQGDPEQNCVIKVMCYEGKPHLCIFAVRHITVGEELRYDYGVPNLPWRKRKNVSKARGTKKTHEDRLETAASQIWNKKRKNEEKLENADHAVTPRCSVSSGIGNDQLHHITGIVDNVNPKDTSGVENVVVTGILDKSGCPQTLEIVDGNRTLVITGFSEDTRHKNTQENGDGGESINMTELGIEFNEEEMSDCDLESEDKGFPVLYNVDGGWSSWSEWTRCTRDCDGGQSWRTRECTDPAPLGNGADCFGHTKEGRECNSHSCQGSWSCWSISTPCSVTCGHGITVRTRQCQTQPPGFSYTLPCEGQDAESASCYSGPCINVAAATGIEKQDEGFMQKGRFSLAQMFLVGGLSFILGGSASLALFAYVQSFRKAMKSAREEEKVTKIQKELKKQERHSRKMSHISVKPMPSLSSQVSLDNVPVVCGRSKFYDIEGMMRESVYNSDQSFSTLDKNCKLKYFTVKDL